MKPKAVAVVCLALILASGIAAAVGIRLSVHGSQTLVVAEPVKVFVQGIPSPLFPNENETFRLDIRSQDTVNHTVTVEFSWNKIACVDVAMWDSGTLLVCEGGAYASFYTTPRLVLPGQQLSNILITFRVGYVGTFGLDWAAYEAA